MELIHWFVLCVVVLRILWDITDACGEVGVHRIDLDTWTERQGELDG